MVYKNSRWFRLLIKIFIYFILNLFNFLNINFVGNIIKFFVLDCLLIMFI